jgi:hypothetical protein
MTVAPAIPVSAFLALFTGAIPSNLAAQIGAAGDQAPPLAAEVLVPGDRVRIVSEANRGEFMVVAVSADELRVTSARGGRSSELLLPLASLDSLWVARREGAQDQRPSRWGGGSIGAAVGFGTGLVLGIRTEYGAEAGLAYGLVLALPGAILGGVIGEIRGHRRVQWTPLALPPNREGPVR